MFELVTENEKITPHLISSVNLQINPGEGVLIYGDNGVGKTSLVKRIVEKFSKTYQVSFAFQESLDLFYDRSIEDIQQVFQDHLNGLIDMNKLFELLKIFSLDKKKQRLLSQLSGGEMQALKLSLSLAKNADLYILDEPLRALDLEKKQLLLSLFQKMKFTGKALLVIEHQLISFDSGWRKLRLIQTNGILKIEDK